MGRQQQISDEQILKTARRCFLRHGPAISTSVIARELSISQAALFKRFGTKTRLLQSALAPPTPPPWNAAPLPEPDAHKSIKTQLVELGVVYHRYFQFLIPCLSVLRAQGKRPEGICEKSGPADMESGKKALINWLTKAQEMGLARKCDPAPAAECFLSALQMLPFTQHIKGQRNSKEKEILYIERLVGALWDGISPEVKR